MKILITGGGGFLGQGMVLPLAEHGHTLRLMGRSPFETPHERFQGSVTDLERTLEAVKGMDGIIINHMAPREPNAYLTPEVAYHINVTGTANVFYAAEKEGIKRIVLISSTSIKPPPDPIAWVKEIPFKSAGIYGATKECQETIAMHYAREAGMQVSMLRVGYIVDADAMQDKYGRHVRERAPLDTDRRDIGEVARLCLERDDLGFDVFPVMSTHEAMDEWGAAHTRDTLGWEPRYDFDRLPTPQPKEK